MNRSNRRVSIEREFALWRKLPCGPLNRTATRRFMQLLRNAKERITGLSEVDGEVAHNSVELKFSLLQRENAGACIRSAREVVQGIACEHGYVVLWSNQPDHEYLGHNEYFTTLAFPESVRNFVNTNSLHIHFEIERELAFHAYRQLNAVAPWFVLTACDAKERVRMMRITDERRKMFGGLFLPQDLRDMGDYNDFIVQESKNVHRRLERNGTLRAATKQFPAMFRESRVHLSDDKVFSQARIRPSLQLPNGNISVEFRPINGMEDQTREEFLMNVALWVMEAALREGEINSMQSVREFYFFLDENSFAYRKAEEFVQETIKNMTGKYGR